MSERRIGMQTVPLPLHRVRFVDWSPSSITALAFSPDPPSQGASLSTSARSVLAVGRDNGNIDLCTWHEDTSLEGAAPAAKGWMIETTLLGDVHYKIDALAFTRSETQRGPRLRLFSISGGSVVTEHYLPEVLARTGEQSGIVSHVHEIPHGEAVRTLSSQGGAIWSLAASPLGKYLAIGCEDGVVRLLNIEDDAFEHLASVRPREGDAMPRMTRVASRIVSLAWGPPRKVERRAAKPQEDDSSSEEEEEDAWREGFLLGGLGNSTAAVWDVLTGQLRSRLTVLKNRNEHTIIWSVAVLADETLITGDSTGRVTFFDARSRVPIPGATFQAHTAGSDILCLCVNSDASAVYSAGVDQKVAEYTSIGAQKWAMTGVRRLHAHDIRALAMDPPYNIWRAHQAVPPPARLPVLVSAGIDFHIVLTPASPPQPYKIGRGAGKQTRAAHNPISSSASTSFADTTQRRIPYVPQSMRTAHSVAAICPQRCWIALRRDQSVAIWALEGSADLKGAWRKVCELSFRMRSNLGAMAASHDGKFLAVSDMYETKLFALDGDASNVSPRRISSLGPAIHGKAAPAPGASVLTFTPDSTRLVLCTLRGAFVYIVQLSHGASEAQLLKTFSQHRQRYAAEEGRDGRALAGDARVRSAKQHTPLAVESSGTRDVYAAIVLGVVSPDGQYLLTVDSGRRMHVFNLDTLAHQCMLASPAGLPTAAAFHPERPNVLVVTLPTNHVAFYDLEVGTSLDAADWELTLRAKIDAQLSKIREPVVGCVWLQGEHGNTLLLYGPTWICTARRTDILQASKKRRNSEATQDGDWSIRTTFKYQPLLYVGALHAPGAQPELVVVERPYFSLVPTLPPAFYRGASYGF
ncbi:U3 small nucleolar RNA-associated protein [Malassezia vespertilionis]|uniref:Utp4p n=1 Tax=Malassezia vespertilionis TaxID=2020962 RepID=A0A2N1JBB3_9BASI|nr:U3 small nucleolar RNA-associated protein [Malassezia vespertilionis]PKI83848.1 Utp4p [Malassezia vespertilionis]WFD06850.1 U3 small nucleolar RNA-associated protein [Malassezia vespertilionis]